MGCGTNFVVRGLTTWFCCGHAWGPCGGTGHGACGTCNSGSRQCAWPNASDACRAITRPQDCGLSLPRHGCGHVFYVTNRCNGRCVGVRIADCGPDTNSWCGQRRCCGDVCGSNRVIDLTASAYAAIADLSTGIRPVRVDN